jgi:hypothetical protein
VAAFRPEVIGVWRPGARPATTDVSAAVAHPLAPLADPERLRRRVELALAGRAIEWPFTRAASFHLDRPLIRHEAPRTRSTMRGMRRQTVNAIEMGAPSRGPPSTATIGGTPPCNDL